MGAKLQQSFLTNKDNYIILSLCADVLVEKGWSYNEIKPGMYNYWIDAPAWKLGDSVQVFEERLGRGRSLREVVRIVSAGYSPLVELAKEYGDVKAALIFNVVEDENPAWRTATISIDEGDFEKISENGGSIKEELTGIFMEIAEKLAPYFACGAAEIGRMPEPDNEFRMDETYLGYINYISAECAENSGIRKALEKEAAFTVYHMKNDDIVAVCENPYYALTAE